MSLGLGTDLATTDVPNYITGQTGPPVASLDKREGPLADWRSRAQYFVD